MNLKLTLMMGESAIPLYISEIRQYMILERKCGFVRLNVTHDGSVVYNLI